MLGQRRLGLNVPHYSVSMHNNSSILIHILYKIHIYLFIVKRSVKKIDQV